jgi:DNA-binding beta-propeller fold protein YncE
LVGLVYVALVILMTGWTSAATLYGAYSPNGPGELITIDTATGAPTVVGATSSAIDGLAFAPDGTLYAADNTNNQLVTLDPATGAVASVIGPYGVPITVEGLSVRPSDSVLFGIDVLNSALITLNTATGTVTTIGSLGVNGMAGLAFNLDGSVLYAAAFDNGCLYTVNQSAGATTQVGCAGAGSTGGPLGLARDPVSGTLFVAEWWGGADAQLSIVSEVDGSRTTVGAITGFDQIEGIAFDDEVPVELMRFSVE